MDYLYLYTDDADGNSLTDVILVSSLLNLDPMTISLFYCKKLIG